MALTNATNKEAKITEKTKGKGYGTVHKIMLITTLITSLGITIEELFLEPFKKTMLKAEEFLNKQESMH